MAPSKPETPNMFAAYQPESPVAIEFRRLFVRVKRLGAAGGVHTLMVTSARRGEGKTTAASQLALTAALHGHRQVLLVDLDLRRPRVHAVTGLPQRPGVTEVLRRSSSLDEALCDTPLANFKVLPSGRVQHAPSVLLESPRLRELLEELKTRFEFVVLDAPPVIPVTDPMVFAPLVDVTLLVVMAGETPRAVVQRAKALLQDAEVQRLGVVVNNVDEVLPYYYDYRYYGYSYESHESPAEAPAEGKESS
ncbi:MAG TPA: CpsD/CapB family tyrosine-protein kinase [Candidatus Saccharimonadales bacterium]|nr:CpsD/CapB family tyrosine-protein kinase [Candidatus Saccharimonadales bacterium]